MGRLIDAEALRRQTISVECGEYIGEDVRDITAVFENDINNAPTVDAVRVVRCGECKHWHQNGFGNRKSGLCNCLTECHGAEDPYTAENHFCSYGERKDGREK